MILLNLSQPALLRLKSFNMYSQTPSCPGHSENLGRTSRHLLEDIKLSETIIRTAIDKRLEALPKFPGLQLNFRNDRSLTALVSSGKKLTAGEMQSIRVVILFLLIGLVSVKRIECWKYHVMYAAGYYKKTWSKGLFTPNLFHLAEDRTRWSEIRQLFQQSFWKLFHHLIHFEVFPKGHDPEVLPILRDLHLKHDDDIIRLFGSFLNLDEMNFEGCHQVAKRNARHHNNHNTDYDLLKEVLKDIVLVDNQENELRQLGALFGNHFGLYESFLHPWQSKTKPAFIFKGVGTKENWFTETSQWVHPNLLIADR